MATSGDHNLAIDNPAHPFAWTKTADQILAKAKRPATINSGH